MAEEQLKRPQEGHGAIKYGDVFEMSGELADMPISQRDAAAMQSAENRAFGKTLKGGPADLMHSAASKNRQAGFVTPDDDSSGDPTYQTTAESHVHVPLSPLSESTSEPPSDIGMENKRAADLTIGDALEAAGVAMGDKPVEWNDAAAIAGAEMRATGANVVAPDGIGASAEAAVTVNELMMLDEDKSTVAELLRGAKGMLSNDKPVEEQDVECVRVAELRQDTEGVVTGDQQRNPATVPGGVADTVAMAARLNEP